MLIRIGKLGMNNKLLLGIAINTSFLVGCSSISENFSAYQPVSMQMADVIPSKNELSGAKVKVVLFTPDDGSIDLAKRSNVGHSIISALNTYLSEGGVETVDRRVAHQLESELKLAESKGKAEYQGPDIADYAINGDITNVKVSASFNERYVHINKSTGKRYVRPAYCRFTAKVTGNLKLYALPALTYAKTISIDGAAISETETSNSRCPIYNSSKYSLLRSAAERAVKRSKVDFQNFLAPKAYVLERRVLDGDSIFKISAGTSSGFIAERDVNFFTAVKNKNVLTGKTTIETYPVTKGEVVEGLTALTYSWITVDDSDKALNIKLGDMVKLKFSKRWFE